MKVWVAYLVFVFFLAARIRPVGQADLRPRNRTIVALSVGTAAMLYSFKYI